MTTSIRRSAGAVAWVLTLACLACASPPTAPPPAPRFQDAPGSGSAGSIGAAAAMVTPDAPALAELNSAAAIEAARRDYGPARFLGEATMLSGTTIDDVEIGGLSGITWVGDNRYLAISDDRGDRGPGRFYELDVSVAAGQLTPDGLRVVGWTVLQAPDGRPLAPQTYDMEGIALAPDGTLYVSSEGEARAGIAPFVAHFERDGTHIDSLPLGKKFLPVAGRSYGVRGNLALESLTIEPGGRFLFTATENALQQDGPRAEGNTGSPSRIAKIDLATGQTVAEYVYEVDPISLDISLLDVYHTSGLVDLIALDPMHLLALERSFVAGYGFVSRIFWVCLEDAANVVGLDSLSAAGQSAPRPVDKQVFVDLGGITLRFDNLEGMTLGPTLEDGRRVLLMIADNNFNAAAQITQLVAFAVPGELRPPR